MENINASFKWKSFFFFFWKKKVFKKDSRYSATRRKKKSCFQIPIEPLSHRTHGSKEKKVYLREE